MTTRSRLWSYLQGLHNNIINSVNIYFEKNSARNRWILKMQIFMLSIKTLFLRLTFSLLMEARYRGLSCQNWYTEWVPKPKSFEMSHRLPLRNIFNFELLCAQNSLSFSLSKWVIVNRWDTSQTLKLLCPQKVPKRQSLLYNQNTFKGDAKTSTPCSTLPSKTAGPVSFSS